MIDVVSLLRDWKIVPKVPTYTHADQLALLNKMAVGTTFHPPAATQEIPMSFKSVLSDIGSTLKKVFKLGTAVAVAAEPFVDIAFPGVAPLFNSIVTEVGQAETAAAAAGAQTGTGAQKLAWVTASIEGSIADYEKTNNLTTPLTQVQIEAAANAVVAFLNALPSANPAVVNIEQAQAPTPTPAPVQAAAVRET